jgi:mannose-6-phosphate isomerase-like protein (cupin superfamily)
VGATFIDTAGTMSVLVGAEWVEATAGSFVLVPGNMTHDFENRSPERAGMLNVSAPETSSSACRASRSGSRSVLPPSRTPDPHA